MDLSFKVYSAIECIKLIYMKNVFFSIVNSYIFGVFDVVREVVALLIQLKKIDGIFCATLNTTQRIHTILLD